MRTIIKIAWRNIFRNKLRSFVVVGSIAIGVWALVFLISFMSGMMQTYVDNAVKNQTSHLQVHNPEFLKEKESSSTIRNAENILARINSHDFVESASLRTLTNAMLATGRGTRGVMIKGVDPEPEKFLTALDKSLVSGEYFNRERNNQIIIGKNLAEKLSVSERKKVILTFQDKEGEMISSAFRVTGTYSTGNSMTDDLNVYVDRKDLNRLMGDSLMAHQIGILVNDFSLVDKYRNILREENPGLSVQTYKEISTDLDLFENQIFVSSALLIAIFMLALIFGIVNTMLMAVLERSKEIGVLMAIGMKKSSVFSMVVWETLFLGLLSAPLGLGLGVLTVLATRERGIDLSNYGKGMEEFGLASIVYPNFEPGIYFAMAMGVFITAVSGAVYPAIKSIRLNPVEAIRKI